ncbi:MAG: Crp/Fnr family transcriptional regulator [Bacillota bacterium]
MAEVVLSKFRLFRGLPEEELARYARFFTHRQFGRREQMTFPEECTDAVFFVSRGRVKISYFSEDGKEFTVIILGPGEMYSRHSEGTVTALEDTEIWLVSMTDFRRMLAENPQLPLRLIRILGGILRETNNAIQNLVFRGVSSRLARFLLRQAAERGKEGPEGMVVPLALTHEDVANLIGSSRQTVTSTLRRFEQNGIISLNRKNVIIKDWERLQELAT